MTARPAAHRMAVTAAAASLVTGVLTVTADAPVHAATVRYASPRGGGTVCSQAKPCSIIEAVDQAPAAAEVVIQPGHYGSAAHPLTTEITDATTGHLVVHGAAGKPAPVIHSAADYAIRMLSSRVSDLHVIATGTNGGAIGTNGDHLRIEAVNTDGPACSFTVALSESLCVGSGDAADGIGYVVPGSVAIAINNVTAIAGGAHAAAFAVHETGAGLARVNVSSSIFLGATYDVDVSAAAGGQAELNLSHSRMATRAPTKAGGGDTSINDVGGNVSVVPKLVNPSAGDYREAPGSATVDAGTKDPDFATDLAGRPRTLGDGTDIGGYELLPKPAVGTLAITSTGKHSIKATVKVNPQGVHTSVRLVAGGGHGAKHGKRVSAGHGTTLQKVSLAIKGLRRHQRYRVRAVAHSAAGHASSSSVALSTR